MKKTQKDWKKNSVEIPVNWYEKLKQNADQWFQGNISYEIRYRLRRDLKIK